MKKQELYMYGSHPVTTLKSKAPNAQVSGERFHLLDLSGKASIGGTACEGALHPKFFILIPKPEFSNPKPTTRHPRIEIRNPKPESRKPEDITLNSSSSTCY